MARLPRFERSIPVIENNRTPTLLFHIMWQKVVEAIELLQTSGTGGAILELDGGDSTSTGTPGIVIDGGSS